MCACYLLILLDDRIVGHVCWIHYLISKYSLDTFWIRVSFNQAINNISKHTSKNEYVNKNKNVAIFTLSSTKLIVLCFKRPRKPLLPFFVVSCLSFLLQFFILSFLPTYLPYVHYRHVYSAKPYAIFYL